MTSNLYGEMYCVLQFFTNLFFTKHTECYYDIFRVFSSLTIARCGSFIR